MARHVRGPGQSAGGGVGSYVIAATKQHADDTPIPVLAPSNKTRTARLWVYVREDSRAGSAESPRGMVCLLAPTGAGSIPSATSLPSAASCRPTCIRVMRLRNLCCGGGFEPGFPCLHIKQRVVWWPSRPQAREQDRLR